MRGIEYVEEVAAAPALPAVVEEYEQGAPERAEKIEHVFEQPTTVVFQGGLEYQRQIVADV